LDIDKAALLKFNENADGRGRLVVIEGTKDIPFEIKRLFYIYGSDTGAVRGQHANRETEFVLINVCGSSKVKVKGVSGEKVFDLDKPHIGVYLPKMIWKEMYGFSPDSILLCLASTVYDPDDYLRDYEQFLKEEENE